MKLVPQASSRRQADAVNITRMAPSITVAVVACIHG